MRARRISCYFGAQAANSASAERSETFGALLIAGLEARTFAGGAGTAAHDRWFATTMACNHRIGYRRASGPPTCRRRGGHRRVRWRDGTCRTGRRVPSGWVARAALRRGRGGGGGGRGRMFDNGDLRLIIMSLLSDQPAPRLQDHQGPRRARRLAATARARASSIPTLTLLEELGQASVPGRARRAQIVYPHPGRACRAGREPARGGSHPGPARERGGIARRSAAAVGAGDGEPGRGGAAQASGPFGERDADLRHGRRDRRRGPRCRGSVSGGPRHS